MSDDLQDKIFRLQNKITKLLENLDLMKDHPELEVIVNEIALKQPASSSPEQVQANLQERARAIIEADPGLEGYFED